MTDWRSIAALALALNGVVQSVALWQLAERVRVLEQEVLPERPTIPRYESVGGTGNVHRRKLGWRVRVVLWWVGVKERLARWKRG